VFWGHEHECRLDPENVVCGEKQFSITQPGSSVATSLSESEEKEKAVGLLEVRGSAFKLTKVK
jgi:double-strand break repair protein MRE11